MTWVATDNFDSYTPTADLATQNGGSGWTNAWSRRSGTGTQTIQTAPAGGQGGNAVSGGTGDPSEYIRDISAITAGTMYGRMMASTATPNDNISYALMDVTSTVMTVRFGPTGNIEIYDNGVAGYVSIQAYSINSWYAVEIDFDNVAQPNLYRARIDGGAYTGYKTVIGGSYSTISRLMLENSATTVSPGNYWDDIKPGGETVTPLSANGIFLIPRRVAV